MDEEGGADAKGTNGWVDSDRDGGRAGYSNLDALPRLRQFLGPKSVTGVKAGVPGAQDSQGKGREGTTDRDQGGSRD